MKTQLTASLCIAALCAATMAPRAGAGQRRELAPASRIDRVMVYHDRALVTRVARCGEVEPGVYEMLINNLPGLLADESVRAKALGPGVKILDVEVRTFHLEKSPEKVVQEEQDRLQRMEDEKRGFENRIAVLKREAEYLEGTGESFLGVPARAAGGRSLGMRYRGRLGIRDYDAMRDYLNGKFRDNAAAIQREEQNIRRIEKKILVQKERLAKLQGSTDGLSRKKSIRVTAEVRQRGPLDMEISYMNQRISWKPGYDIRVFPGENRTEFIGYGIVAQSSGEDWTDARIAFSTAQPAVRGYLPELIPVYATVSSKMPRTGGKKQRNESQLQINRAILDNIGTVRRRGDDTMTDSAAERGASRQVGSLVFQVPARADIPGDGSPHRTPISRNALPVKFEYLCIPKLSPYAHLTAVGTNTLGSPILQGDLNIFMGNDFVGSSYTDNILPGEEFELVLSVNENIRVTRSLEEKEEQEAGFLGSTKKINYRFLVTIENYTESGIVMNLFDQVPVSRTSEIEIRNVTFTHEPRERDRKGICKWRFEMKPKETIKLGFGFTVSVPKDQEAAFFRTNLSPAEYLEQLSSGSQDEELNLDDYSKDTKSPALRQKK